MGLQQNITVPTCCGLRLEHILQSSSASPSVCFLTCSSWEAWTNGSSVSSSLLSARLVLRSHSSNCDTLYLWKNKKKVTPVEGFEYSESTFWSLSKKTTNFATNFRSPTTDNSSNPTLSASLSTNCTAPSWQAGYWACEQWWRTAPVWSLAWSSRRRDRAASSCCGIQRAGNEKVTAFKWKTRALARRARRSRRQSIAQDGCFADVMFGDRNAGKTFCSTHQRKHPKFFESCFSNLIQQRTRPYRSMRLKIAPQTWVAFITSNSNLLTTEPFLKLFSNFQFQFISYLFFRGKSVHDFLQQP